MKLFSTSCENIFLGWDAPLLPAAAAKIRQRMASGERLDLGNWICVLPSSHGASRLKMLLRGEADAHKLKYIAPDLITVGNLAERLYQPRSPIALELEQTLAWTRVLRAVHPDALSPLLPNVPAADSIGPWMEIAGAIRRLHEDLSASQLTFGDVKEVAETELEKRRWQLLQQLYASYQAALDEAGLSDPHASRRQAVLQDRCTCHKTIALIGTSDLSDALIAMLRSLDSELIAIVAAPPTQAFRFDEFGCVDTVSWLEHELPIQDDHLVAAGDIADQASAVAESLAEFAADHRADEMTVGVTDESHVGQIELELHGCGYSTHRHLGWSISQTALGRLLDLTGIYLSRHNWQSLAALVRHSDVCAYVSEKLGVPTASWLTQLDELLAEFFPVRVADPLSAAAIEQCPLAKQVADLIDQWLDPFLGHDRSIAQWSQQVQRWLDELYPPPQSNDTSQATDSVAVSSADPNGEQRQAAAEPTISEICEIDDRTRLALDAVRRMIGRFAALNDRLDVAVGGAAAIEMLAARLSDFRIQQPVGRSEVTILGWLDLALDDARVLVVNGLNHPFVPAGVTNDPFLPGTLRSQLRMADNDRRFARDIYALHLMIQTRSAIRLIVGRRAADQSPTPPSRLLAAASQDDVARRVRRLLGGQRNASPIPHRWDDGPSQAQFPIPQLGHDADQPAITSMSVTAFANYLACPYRFYLRHVLKLQPLDDSSSELAANQFGNLIHGALERFGESSDRDETRVSKIESMLIAHLHDFAEHHYGDSVSTAVTLQIAQAERRLKVVAQKQAERIAEGWTIHASEASVDEKNGAGIDVGGKRMGLRGRFDRIDFHPATGRWAILDYKTHGHRPEKKHLRKTDAGFEWIDLQLPLYRMMIPFLGIDADPREVQLGYFNISEKDEETRINIAEFSEDQMTQAEQVIRQCIARIWAGDFNPTSDRVQYDDYSMILQTGIASRLLDQVDATGQEA